MSLFHHQSVAINRHGMDRRSFVHAVSAGALAAGTLNFRDVMTLKAEDLRKEGMSMILLFMQGAPSQFETFDPKPGTPNSGPTKAIKTAVPGIEIANGWEQTAKQMGEIAVIRSMTNKEGQHQRALYQLHTGYIPAGSVKHPSLGSNIAREIGDISSELPSIVSVGRTIGAGFLGVDYEPFVVFNPAEMPQNTQLTVEEKRFERRLGVLNKLQQDFAQTGGKQLVESQLKLYNKTSRMILSPKLKAFDISEEPANVQDRYGKTPFGQGCLLARRLVESGVTFVEVVLNGWDTHDDCFERVGKLAEQTDPAMAALISDLKDRGRLDSTLIVWMGEFGRTPKINPRGGRDHYPRVFNALMAGGGVKGGQIIGASTKDGTAVEKDPVTVPDLFTSICKSMKVDPAKENISPQGRPLKIVDGGKPIEKLFA